MTRTNTISMLFTLTAIAGLAVAQPTSEGGEDKDLLRGPDVVKTNDNPDNAPDPMNPDNMSAEERQKLMAEMFEERPIEMREMVITLRSIGNIRSGNNRLGITTAQNEQIRAITDKFREDIRAFQQANMEEIRKLRNQINEEARERREAEREQAQRESEKEAKREKDGNKPTNTMSEQGDEDTQNQTKPPQQSEAASKLREMIASSPATKTAIKSIKSVLSEEQFEAVRERIFESRIRTEQRRERAMNGNRGTRPNPARRGVDPDRAREQQRDRNNQRDKSRNNSEREDD